MKCNAQLPFMQVDVFGILPFSGNPLGVVLQADTLDITAMKRIANWLNLSETVFLLSPTNPKADYCVRIFTASGAELPFAGHPTLGACHAWIESKKNEKNKLEVVQECGVGLVTLKRNDQQQWCFMAPPMQRSELPLDKIEIICAALNITALQIKAAQLLDNGRPYHALLLDSAQTVLDVKPNLNLLAQNGINVGICGHHVKNDLEANAANLEVRYFAPSFGVNEDPITGNLNGALAQWLIEEGYAPITYTAAQGTVLGRTGRVSIMQDLISKEVWVGGCTITCTQGMINIV